jgi:hypothetical protein
MPELKVTILVEMDGAELPGFPLIYRQNVTEAVPLDGVQQAADNDTVTFHQVPGSVMQTLQTMVLTADQAINLKFNNSSFLPLAAGGCIVLVGANIGAGAATNVTINNPGASDPANLLGVTGGAAS